MVELIHFDVLGLVFFTALFLSLIIVPATIVLAHKVGAVDLPKSRSSHSIPTTRLGGLGIATSLVFSCLMFLPLNNFTWAFLAGLLLIIVTGLIDDISDIGPRWKFVGQIAAASAFVILGGGTLEHLGSFLGMGEMTLGKLAIPFTIFCIVGGMNAFNLSDGLDGLAGGMAAIAAVFFAYFSWHIGALDQLLVSVALLGAVMGFLRYNSHPARLFMGDSGSLTIGYVLAALLVSGSQREGLHIPLVAWVLVVSLPLLDTLFVMGRRVRHGDSPFLPDRTHLHHRLLSLGLTHSTVVAVMYAAMALLGTIALVLKGFPEWYSFAVLCVSGGILFGGVLVLQHLGVSFASGKKKRSRLAFRQWALLKWASRLIRTGTIPVSVLLLLFLCLPALFFPLPELSRNGTLALSMMLCILIYYSFNHSQQNNGILHGSVYVLIFALFFLYNLGSATGEHWSVTYLTFISVMAAVWVLVKIIFRRSTAILGASSFEILMVFLSWFLPFVLFQELRLPGNVVDSGRIACLQVLPFISATKIYFNVQPHGNKWVVAALCGAIVIVVLRGSWWWISLKYGGH